jgi:hypothetical protein
MLQLNTVSHFSSAKKQFVCLPRAPKKGRLIYGMYHMPCFVWLELLVPLVAATQKHYERQMLEAGTKQSKQAERAVRAALCLFCFVPATSTLVLLKS